MRRRGAPSILLAMVAQMQMQMQMQMLTSLGSLGSQPPACCPHAAAHTHLPCRLAHSSRVLLEYYAGRFGFVTTAAGADVFVHCSQMGCDRSLWRAGTAVLFQARHSIVSIAVLRPWSTLGPWIPPPGGDKRTGPRAKEHT